MVIIKSIKSNILPSLTFDLFDNFLFASENCIWWHSWGNNLCCDSQPISLTSHCVFVDDPGTSLVELVFILGPILSPLVLRPVTV